MSSSSIRRTPLSHPVYSEFPAASFVTASGVAIFHLKTAHVVLCYHTRDKYWFLPKGRRDAGEDSRRAAQREGFEEVRVCPSSLFGVQVLICQYSQDTATASCHYRYSIDSRNPITNQMRTQ